MPEEHDPAAVVRKEIYESLGYIKGTVDAIDKKLDDHAPRLLRLERKVNILIGAWAAAGAGLGATIHHIKNLF